VSVLRSQGQFSLSLGSGIFTPPTHWRAWCASIPPRQRFHSCVWVSDRSWKWGAMPSWRSHLVVFAGLLAPSWNLVSAAGDSVPSSFLRFKETESDFNGADTATLEKLCAYCFGVLENKLVEGEPEPRALALFSGKDDPLFVTWENIRRNETEKLRGCVGNFGNKSWSTSVKDLALAAAKDSRFVEDPITSKEIKDLSVEVSVLKDFEKCNTKDDWTWGVHGIQIEFEVGGETYTATYLPKVMEKEGWSKDKALKELVEKSGYQGNPEQVIQKAVELQKLRKYQADVASMTYAEYKDSA